MNSTSVLVMVPYTVCMKDDCKSIGAKFAVGVEEADDDCFNIFEVAPEIPSAQRIADCGGGEGSCLIMVLLGIFRRL